MQVEQLMNRNTSFISNKNKRLKIKCILKMPYFYPVGDVLPIGHMVINRIGDLRRVAGI